MLSIWTSSSKDNVAEGWEDFEQGQGYEDKEGKVSEIFSSFYFAVFCSAFIVNITLLIVCVV